jgi:hypothetical protein
MDWCGTGFCPLVNMKKLSPFMTQEVSFSAERSSVILRRSSGTEVIGWIDCAVYMFVSIIKILKISPFFSFEALCKYLNAYCAEV